MAAPANKASSARTPTLDLALELLRRPSVTPEDGGCQELLARRLEASGFTRERFDRNGVTNSWLRRGRQRPTLVFAGHTDVVPPGPGGSWRSAPFAPEVRDGALFARGASDMKSSLAAFAVAAEEFVARRPGHAGSIALLLTSDEEGPSIDGTAIVVEALRSRGEAVDFCIVGEPTCVQHLGDTIKIGRRGSLSAHLTVRGIQGHVAYPQLARNPIHELAPALDALVRLPWDDASADFPATSFQVSGIHAGTGAGNVIPGTCEIDFNLRFNPASTPESLRERIEAVLRGHGLDFEIQWTLGARPFQCAPGTLLRELGGAVLDITGVQPQHSTSGGTSDARFLAQICPEVVEFGPPNATIHRVDECIRIADLEPLKDIYRRTLERVLGH